MKVTPITIAVFSFLSLASCCHIEDDEQVRDDRPRITVTGGGGGFVKEKLFKELDTSVWLLHAYEIKKKTEKLKRFKANSSDEYKFLPRLNAVIKNELRIGKISWQDAKVPGGLKDMNGKPFGKRYSFQIKIEQPHEPWINGEFRIIYGKWDRLHLEQRRINNRTEESEYRRLIFYKKE
jgi:hypothetical protein